MDKVLLQRFYICRYLVCRWTLQSWRKRMQWDNNDWVFGILIEIRNKFWFTHCYLKTSTKQTKVKTGENFKFGKNILKNDCSTLTIFSSRCTLKHSYDVKCIISSKYNTYIMILWSYQRFTYVQFRWCVSWGNFWGVFRILSYIYNNFHDIVRFFDVLPNVLFTRSETMRNYYL